MSKQITRTRILDTALLLFSSRGYSATTTREIARLADINEVTLFRHFGSKEQLFQELTDEYVEDMNIPQNIENCRTKSFSQTIFNITRDYLQLCYRSADIYKIQMRLPDDTKKFIRLKLSRAFIGPLVNFFSEMKDANIVNGDPSIMAVTLINHILGAFTIYLLSAGSFTDIPLEVLADEQTKQFIHYYETPESASGKLTLHCKNSPQQ